MTLRLKSGTKVIDEPGLHRFLKEMSNIEFEAYKQKEGDMVYNWIDRNIKCPERSQKLLDTTTRETMLFLLQEEHKPRLTRLTIELEKEKRVKRQFKVEKAKDINKKLEIRPRTVADLIKDLRELYHG
jgi:hypothetical protein